MYPLDCLVIVATPGEGKRSTRHRELLPKLEQVGKNKADQHEKRSQEKNCLGNSQGIPESFSAACGTV
jgi:hypothetical protein